MSLKAAKTSSHWMLPSKGAIWSVSVKSCERLFHLHLHDFTDTDHIPPFDGNIQWGEIFAAFKDINYEGVFMFEATSPTPEEVLRKTAAFPKTFVERYGSR